MKKIIVPTDFSPIANNALNFAVETAKVLSAELTILHSYEVSGSTYVDYMGVNKEFNRTMLGEAKQKLELVKKGIEVTAHPTIKTVVSTLALNEAIEEVVKETNADMVVMGTLGASGLKEKLWGSRTSKFIGMTKIPVMVVPDEYKWKKPQKILFATDHFEKNPAVLNYIFELAGLFMAQVQVVVFSDESSDKVKKFVERDKEIPLYEKFLQEEYNEKAILTTHISGEGFDKTLHDFIEANDIDILTMITYQRNFWDRIFNPSLTKKMSYHTTIPLLAIPIVDK